MNYGELKTAVAGYLHTAGLTTEIIGFIERAEQRIGRDLRTQENQRRAVVTTDANGRIEIGAGGTDDTERMVQIASVSTGSGASLRLLPPIHQTQQGSYPTSGDAVAYYTYGDLSGSDTDSGQLQTVPIGATVDLTLYFWEYPETLTGAADGDVRPILTRYPNLYIDGACAEGSIYLRDYDAADWFTGRFDAAIEKANTAYLQRYPILSRGVYPLNDGPPAGI